MLVAAGWFLSLGARLIFPSLLPYVQAEFGLSLSISGLLISVLWLAYGLGQFPGGILGDRIGEGNVLTVSTFAAAIALVAVALSVTVELLFVATILFGLATALYGPTRITIMSSIYPNRDGMAIGLTLAAGNVGNAILPAVAGLIAAAYTWEFGFAVVVPLFLLVAVGTWLVVPRRVSRREADATVISLSYMKRVLGVIRTPSIAIITSVQFIGALIIQAFTGFYPTYLIAVKGFSPGVAATIFGLFFAMAIVVQPSMGACADRFGSRRTLIAVFSFIFLALTALPLLHSLWEIVALTTVLSFINGFGPITLKSLANQLPEEVIGSGLGLIRTGYFSVAAIGPVFVGTMGDFGYFDEAFYVLGATAFVAVLLSSFVSDA